MIAFWGFFLFICTYWTERYYKCNDQSPAQFPRSKKKKTTKNLGKRICVQALQGGRRAQPQGRSKKGPGGWDRKGDKAKTRSHVTQQATTTSQWPAGCSGATGTRQDRTHCAAQQSLPPDSPWLRLTHGLESLHVWVYQPALCRAPGEARTQPLPCCSTCRLAWQRSLGFCGTGWVRPGCPLLGTSATGAVQAELQACLREWGGSNASQLSTEQVA